MKKVNLNSFVAMLISACMIITCFAGIPVFAANTTNESLKLFNDYVKEVGNDFTSTDLLAKLQAIDENATLNEYFIKHAVDGVSVKGTNNDGWDSEMVLAGNDGYIAVNATVNGETFSGVAYIPHNEEVITGEVAYYQASSHGDFVVADGVVTDYTGNATILVFANEGVSVNMSNASCKDQIEAIYFRSGYNNSKPLVIATRSFDNWSNLKAVMFQQKGIYVCGTFGEYIFANNPELKYVRLMDSISLKFHFLGYKNKFFKQY